MPHDAQHIQREKWNKYVTLWRLCASSSAWRARSSWKTLSHGFAYQILVLQTDCNLFIGWQTFSCVLFRSSGCDCDCLSAIKRQEDDLIHCRMKLHLWLKGRLWNLHLVTNATTALIRSDLVNDAKWQLYLEREGPGKAFCLLLILRFFFQSMKILTANCLIHTQWACLHV